MFGTGIALTLGRGNELVCEAVRLLGARLVGQQIEDLMANIGEVSRQLAEDCRLVIRSPRCDSQDISPESVKLGLHDRWRHAKKV